MAKDSRLRALGPARSGTLVRAPRSFAAVTLSEIVGADHEDIGLRRCVAP